MYDDEIYSNIVNSNCKRYGLPTTTFTKVALSQSDLGRFINEFFNLLLFKFDFPKCSKYF